MEQLHIATDDLRFLFIQMLFSLVIAEIAMQFATLISQKRPLPDASPILAHLLLVTIVVTTSWVVWCASVANEQHPEYHLHEVFSWPYALLLIDVGLVICYFVIAKAAGIPTANTDPITPSAERGSFWLMIFFAGYILW